MQKKVLKIGSYFVYTLIAILLLFELSFRFQLIDFYKKELTSLNPNLKKGEKSILFFGDSFTAHINSYVSFLRRFDPEKNFVNCAISGSGIPQHELFFDQRIEDHNPQHIVYQFYVGNDFSDIEHPLNYDSISLIRNSYWAVSDRFLSLHYLNFRLAFLRANNLKVENIRNDAFSSTLYNHRVKLQFMANPLGLENGINLTGRESELYKVWKKKFKRLIHKVDTSISISILVIPHCAQINTTYQNRMENMGAVFNTDVQETNYPLIERLRKDFPSLQIINPLINFKREDRYQTSLYYENDPHLTQNGQKLLAKVVGDALNLNSTITDESTP